jgi:hypothetical protein
MIPRELLARVLADVRRHCEDKGHREGPGVNNFVPHDAVAAFAMARFLVGSGQLDHFLAVAPEGHIYGYFLERLGVKTLSVFADYPPTRCESDDDLSVLRNSRVLIVEDDVIGGRTLRLVVDHLKRFGPAFLSLYLGHTQGIQHIRNVPGEIGKIYIAEDCLDWGSRDEHERNFTEFFGGLFSKRNEGEDTRKGG